MNGFAYVPLAALGALLIGALFANIEVIARHEKNDMGSDVFKHVALYFPAIFITCLLYRFANKAWAIGFFIISLLFISGLKIHVYLRDYKKNRDLKEVLSEATRLR